MKTLFCLLFTLVIISGCRTSKEGCSSTRFSGERYKATNFKW